MERASYIYYQVEEVQSLPSPQAKNLMKPWSGSPASLLQDSHPSSYEKHEYGNLGKR